MSDPSASSAGAPQRAPGRPAPTRTDLRLVQISRAKSRSRQLIFAFALVIMFAALLTSALFHGVLVAGQQRLDHMDRRVEQRQMELSRSRLRVAQLSSPARVVDAAKRSGMIVPDHTTWLSGKAAPTTPPGNDAAPPSAGQKPSGGVQSGTELASRQSAVLPPNQPARTAPAR